MVNKSSIILLLIIVSFKSVFSQENEVLENINSHLENVIPPSPNAASLGKYGEIPVSYYTGVPSISIPIWDMKGTELSLSVSLSYHASGIKVDEIPSWVGAGWSLNAGGVITRSVKGKPDELLNGYLTKGELFPNPTTNYSEFWGWSPDLTTLGLVARGLYDIEPDNFYYNFNGRSGKFVFDPYTDSIRTIPYERIKISVEKDFRNEFQRWTIITEDGTKYIFGKHPTENRSAIESTTPETSGDNGSESFDSSWYLIQIISASNKDKIDLYYTAKYDSRTITNSERKYVCLNVPKDCGKTYETSFSQLFINTFELDSIKNNVSTISFKETPLEGNLSFKLSEIKISDNKNKTFKKFELNYETYNDRIFLTSLTELIDLNNKKNPHVFTYYHPELLPARLSFSQDYWGYFNASGNSTLVPKMFVNGELIAGANRTTNPESVKYGVLSEIHYPTKGYTKFEFEANQCQNYEALYYDDLEYVTDMVVFDDRAGSYNVFGFPYTISKIINTRGNQFVQISFSSSNIENDAPYGNGQFFLKNKSTNEIIYQASGQPGQTSIYLFEGKYELIATGNIPKDYVKGTITYIPYYKIIHEADNKKNYIGGVRIKNISNYDGVNGKKVNEISYEYKLESDSTISSGYLITKALKHSYNLTEIYPGSCPSPTQSQLCFKEDNYVVISSGSMNQLGSTQGSHVGYKEVTEKFGEGNGKKVYKYLSSDVHPDLTADVFPFPSPISRDWKRGLVKEIKTINSEKELVKKELFSYEFSEHEGDVNRVIIPAGVVGYKWFCYFCTNGGQASYAYQPYDIEAAWQYQSQKKTIDYFGNDSLISTENYYYDYPKNAFLNRVEKITSDGQIVINKIWYPEDMPNEGINPVLITQNIINKPVKTEKYLNNNFLKGNQFYYNIYGKPLQIDESYFKTGTGELISEQIIKCQYNDNQNLARVEKKDGIKTSYLWAYNYQYPVIKIESSDLKLPVDQLQNTVNGLTLSGGETKASIDADIVKLKNSFAAYQGDEYLFAIYTYKPLVGVTSETDTRGRTIYYLYDGFGRLKEVRDHDYNIIKQNEYHFGD